MSGKQPGAIWQITLFMTIWFVLQTVLNIPLTAGMFMQTFEQSTVTSLFLLWMAFTGLLATIGTVIFMHHFAAGPHLFDLGLRQRRGWLREVIIGLLIGPLILSVILIIELTAGWVQVSPGGIGAFAFGIALVSFIFIAVSEEILFRGYVLQVLERGYGSKFAAIGSSIIFGMLHGINPNSGKAAMIGIFISGLLLAYAFLVTRQLWLPIALHLSWNISEGPIFGFPVSGLPSSGMLNVSVTGPVLVTGGAFGPEAGLVLPLGVGLAAVIIAILCAPPCKCTK